MNLEKEASVSSILKNLWKDTKGLKDLPKDIKMQKMFNKLLGRKGLKAFKKYKGIAGNTAKGLVIPAAGAAAVGGSLYGYKHLKGREKTAVDKNGLTLSQRELIAQRASAAIPNELYNQQVKDAKKGLAIGTILGSAAGYLLGDKENKILRGLNTAEGALLGGTLGSVLAGIPTGRKHLKQLKAEGITQGILAPKISPEAKKKYYDQYKMNLEKKSGVEESVTPTFQSVKNIVDKTTGGSIYGYKRSRNKEKTLPEAIKDIIDRATAGSIYGYEPLKGRKKTAGLKYY
jgi:hypothetical protein